MSQNIMIMGTGRKGGLGYSLAHRYLEEGNTVVATLRKPSKDLDELGEKFPDKLIPLYMDISSTESVNQAAKELSDKIDCINILINNAVSVSPDVDKGFFDVNLDYIANTVNITAVGAGQISMAIARRVGYGKKNILGDKNFDNAKTIGEIMTNR